MTDSSEIFRDDERETQLSPPPILPSSDWRLRATIFGAGIAAQFLLSFYVSRLGLSLDWVVLHLTAIYFVSWTTVTWFSEFFFAESLLSFWTYWPLGAIAGAVGYSLVVPDLAFFLYTCACISALGIGTFLLYPVWAVSRSGLIPGHVYRLRRSSSSGKRERL